MVIASVEKIEIWRKTGDADMSPAPQGHDPGSPCRCGSEQHNAKVADLMEATIGYAS